MPNRFQSITGTDIQSIVRQINRNFQVLDTENVTKTFKGPNATNSIVQGRYRDGRYGQVYYDENGVARILIGQAPDDGRMGIWVSSAGVDVITTLGG